MTLDVKTDAAEFDPISLDTIRDVDKVEDLGPAETGLHRYCVVPRRGKTIAADVAESARDKKWEVGQLTIEKGRLDEVFRELTYHVGEKKTA